MHCWAIREDGKLVGIIEPAPGAPAIHLTERASAEDVAEIINGGVIPIIQQTKEGDHGNGTGTDALG